VTVPTATYSWTSDAGDTVGAGIPGSVSSSEGVFRLKRGLLSGVEVIYEQLTPNQKTLELCPPRSPAQFLAPNTSYPGAVRCPPLAGMDSVPSLDVTLDTGGASTRIVSIVVDSSGNIFGMETFGDIHKFDPGTGLSLKELDVMPSFEVTDLDFEADGSLIAASQAPSRREQRRFERTS